MEIQYYYPIVWKANPLCLTKWPKILCLQPHICTLIGSTLGSLHVNNKKLFTNAIDVPSNPSYVRWDHLQKPSQNY
jgi:hypothetical protein